MNWIEGGIALILLAALFTWMARLWRSRSRRDAELVPPAALPSTPLRRVAAWEGMAVASTHADRPLDRVFAPSLAFRSKATLEVFREGVAIRSAVAGDRWIDRAAVRGADRATWVIDRTVEPGGLVRLRWSAAGAAGVTDIDTYFRFPAGDAGAVEALEELHTTNGPRIAGEGNTSK